MVEWMPLRVTTADAMRSGVTGSGFAGGFSALTYMSSSILASIRSRRQTLPARLITVACFCKAAETRYATDRALWAFAFHRSLPTTVIEMAGHMVTLLSAGTLVFVRSACQLSQYCYRPLF